MVPLLASVTEPPAAVLTLLTVSARSDEIDSARLPVLVMLLSVRPATPVESLNENAVMPLALMLYVLLIEPLLLLWLAVSDSAVSALLLATDTLPAEAIDRLDALVCAETLPLVPSALRLTLLPVIRPEPPMVGARSVLA